MPNLGPMEIMVIFLVALLVLGPTRLPETGRQVGRAFTEFRRWSTGFRRELRDVVDGIAEPYPPTIDPFDFPRAPSAPSSQSSRPAHDETTPVDSKPQSDRAPQDDADLSPGTPVPPRPSASSADKPSEA